MTTELQSETILSRFEEGKPADPTESMSPEDAQKWREQTDEHKDEFKSASLQLEAKTFSTPEALQQYMREHPKADPRAHRGKPKRDNSPEAKAKSDAARDSIKDDLKSRGHKVEDSKKSKRQERTEKNDKAKALQESIKKEVDSWKSASMPALVHLNLERLVSGIEGQVQALRYSADLYRRDPQKYAPQMENMLSAASQIGSITRTLVRGLERVPEGTQIKSASQRVVARFIGTAQQDLDNV